MKPVVSTHVPTLSPSTPLYNVVAAYDGTSGKTARHATHNIGEEGRRDSRKGSSYACRSCD